jgi:hypothetical protein
MNPSLPHSTTQYSNLIVTDCSRAVTLKSGYDSVENTALLTNSYIAGYSRPNCSSCYTDITIANCKNGYAIRMFTVTISGEVYPLATSTDIFSYDAIQSRQGQDSKAFFENVTFENYMNYNSLLPYCSGMSVFRRHSMAADSTACHYLKNTECLNC